MPKKRYNVWTEADEQFLRENFRTMTAADMAETLGRKSQDVANKCFRMRLTKRQQIVKVASAECIKKTERHPVIPGPRIVPGVVICTDETPPDRSEELAKLIAAVDELRSYVGTYNDPVCRNGQAVPCRVASLIFIRRLTE